MTPKPFRLAIRSQLARQLGTDDFDDEQDLLELGLDSIDIIAVVNALEDRLGVSISEEDLFGVDRWTVAGLANAFTAPADEPIDERASRV